MRIATYGTLRKGMPNFDYYKAGLEYLETIELKGYKLYVRRTLPFVMQTGIQTDIVKCDLIFVDSPTYSRQIDLMELNYEYYIDFIQYDSEPYKMYLYEKLLGKSQHIEDGDFVRYAEENNFYKHR